MSDWSPSRVSPRMPAVYVPHGGGPWPFVDLGLPQGDVEELLAYLRRLRALPPSPPRALLVVSAHWEARVPTVTGSARPPMLYDYYGFSPDSYRIRWEAPGDPALAEEVCRLLGEAGWETAVDESRGFDHGTFVPLKVTYPDAVLPTVQLSLVRGLDPGEHLAMGRALAPLLDQRVFLIGSGMSYHNLPGLFAGSGGPASEAFDAWLSDVVAREPAERERALVAWTKAPSARAAHPREEHLMPLMVVAGAAGADRGRVAHRQGWMGAVISAHHFGA